MKPTKAPAPGHPGYPHRPTIAERLVHQEPLAIGAALHRGRARMRPVIEALELEAADPRVARLHARARELQREIAGLLVEVAADVSHQVDHDCTACLVAVDHCERDASMGAGRCCDECSHV